MEEKVVKEKTEDGKHEDRKLKLTITDFISVNHYLSYRAIIKNGRPMATSYKTPEAKKFQKEFTKYVKEQAIEQNWITDPNPFQHYYVDAVFYFPRIDVDVNNYWKVAFDAITDSGVVWVDDNMACERTIKVMYDSKNPRIEYTIYKTDFTGIFDTEKDAEDFKDRCKQCRRYSKNCSLMNKAFEGRIQQEISMDDYLCSKFNMIKN